MSAQTVKGIRLTAPNDDTVWTDTTSVNIGAVTGPVSFFALPAVNGGGGTTSIASISINGTAMALEADRDLQTDLGFPGRWRAARIDGASITGALTIVVTKSTNAGRTNLILCWSDQSTGVVNVAFSPYATGGTTTYAYAATVASNASSQAIFAGIFNASTSVTPTAPTVHPQYSAVDAIGLVNGSSDFRLGALAEPGATSSVLQATLVHAFGAGAAGWVGSFSGSGAPGPTIITHPAPQTVTEGATANFAVIASATGGGALTQQWRKDGANILGAISANYSRSTVLADNGSQISVAVTEAGGTNDGTVNSNNALLTVNPMVSGGVFTASVGPLGNSGIRLGSGVLVHWTVHTGAPGAMAAIAQGSSYTNTLGNFVVSATIGGPALVLASTELPGLVNVHKPLFSQFVTLA